MLDLVDHEFTGDGYELHGATRLKPAPGWHYYEHSQSLAHSIEDLFGIGTGDPHAGPKDYETLIDRYDEQFPGAFYSGGGGFELYNSGWNTY